MLQRLAVSILCMRQIGRIKIDLQQHQYLLPQCTVGNGLIGAFNIEDEKIDFLSKRKPGSNQVAWLIN
jgi:hypothetical protein